MKNFATKNNKLALEMLGPFSKRYLKLVVKELSEKIEKLSEKKKLNNINILNHDEIKKIIDKSSYINNQRVADFFIMDDKKIVLSSEMDLCGKSYAEWMKQYPNINKLLTSRKLLSGYYTVQLHNKQNVKIYAIFSKLPNKNIYILGIIKLNKYLDLTARLQKKNIDNELRAYRVETKKEYHKAIIDIGIYSLIAVVLIIFICFFLSLWFSSSITKPIMNLREQALKLGKGNFNIYLKEKGSLEVRDLVKSFNYLGRELTDYIENLKTEISARERIESEIKVAAGIQQSILPKLTDEFIRKEFDLSAKLNPAKDAAGDFYDFFYIGENRLAILIADVSGKGISSAFFMTLAKTVIRNICSNESDPSMALNKTNKILSTNNSECMFVTAFLCYYDILTGDFIYANAGHHEAVVLQNDKSYRTFGKLHNPPLGIIQETEYRTGWDRLGMGECLVLYTDGVTEAVSASEIEFGEDNLYRILIDNINLTPSELIEKLIAEVLLYEEDNRFDDITVFIFKRIQ
ncbi:MAG TPA: SpoIIE family protein phosphatase [Victivallales bacterium]|nr:SpoIIE family protein phosphatase [Victivallales bacterium]